MPIVSYESPRFASYTGSVSPANIQAMSPNLGSYRFNSSNSSGSNSSFLSSALSSAGLGLVGGLASSLLGNIFSRKAQDRQNAFQLKMWQMNNEYNSPVNQMKRLKQAGLNPLLIYGSGSSNVASSMPQAADANVFQPEFNLQESLATGLAAQQTEAQTGLARSQEAVQRQQLQLLSAQTLATYAEAASKTQGTALQKKVTDLYDLTALTGINQMNADIAKTYSDVQMQDFQKTMAFMQFGLEKFRTYSQLKQGWYALDLQSRDLDIKDKNVENSNNKLAPWINGIDSLVNRLEKDHIPVKKGIKWILNFIDKQFVNRGWNPDGIVSNHEHIDWLPY